MQSNWGVNEEVRTQQKKGKRRKKRKRPRGKMERGERGGGGEAKVVDARGDGGKGLGEIRPTGEGATETVIG
jgi:hypothetical protein